MPATAASTRSPTRLSPLAPLLTSARGTPIPLPPRLARLYGPLRMALPRSAPHVYSNFVTTLDGVVSLGVAGHESGSDISGFSAQDRMVMGLLRAVADVVIVGAGTLAADRRHVWTAEAIFPALREDYRRLRAALGKQGPPLNVVVTGSGAVDLRLPIFAAGKVPVLIVTSKAGAARLAAQRTPASVAIRATRHASGPLTARAILDAVRRVDSGKRVLVEGGPQLLGDFLAQRLLAEQFLTLAPQIAGRDAADRRLGLVMGTTFAPDDPRWGRLVDIRRGGSHLFLRYAFASTTAPTRA